MSPEFSVRDVLAWARTKPADERYRFVDAENCALGQFAREVGGISRRKAASGSYLKLLPPGMIAVAQGRGNSIEALEAQQTFGALVKRLEKLCPETPDYAKIDAYLADLDAVEA